LLFYIVFMFKHLPHKLYYLSMTFVYLMYILVFIGVLSTVPENIYNLIYGVQLGLCMILLYYYHPFRSYYRMDKYDANLIFGIAFFFLLNLVSIPVIKIYLQQVTNEIPIVNEIPTVNEIRL
jgi:hypothetical protein